MADYNAGLAIVDISNPSKWKHYRIDIFWRKQ
ncbi:MAG: hypothetical protein CMQ20_11180 [Gammaproteobacteria bacterium]|nr:hypothetical protein [Gammaproteobacteria bacterium]